MNTIIFLDKKVSKLAKQSEVRKEDLLQLLELVTYLAARKELSLQDAINYTNIIFKLKSE